ncbi:hypothetical protein AKO1_014889 [Acrasis kona]|uniref:Oral cancer-overexpressed protein 1 n=1 Tax=Acrasis kona TaxID=1008807 RepID=A0AAW2Z245_9EUKA
MSCDFLDDALSMEQEFYEQGKRDGADMGEKEGHKEGYEFGVAKGRQFGCELGNILGFAEFMLHLHSLNDDSIQWNDRLVKNLEQLKEAVETFPYTQPQDDIYNEKLENIRSKYKLLEVRLGMISKKNETSVKSSGDTLAF